MCINEGFQDQNCKCKCPDGFSGVNCETVISKNLFIKPIIVC